MGDTMKTNSEIVPSVPKNVLPVTLMDVLVVIRTEEAPHYVLVKINSMNMAMNVNLVTKNVQFVPQELTNVILVSKEGDLHQIVQFSHQLPNQSRLKMSQSDLLKPSIVTKDVVLVLNLLLIVILVVKTEKKNHFVAVLKDIMKIKKKFVLNVLINVDGVLVKQTVLNVLVTESTNQNVFVQQEHGITVMPPVHHVKV